MNDKFIFRQGKYAGKTYGWVQENFPSYIVWCEENAPNLLKEPKPAPTTRKMVSEDMKPNSLAPNMNFWNEGPDPRSLIYINKHKTKNPIEEWNF